MNRVVFWDTSAFLALMNSRDALHQPAVSISQALARDHARMVTTDAVLTEVANGLSRVGHRLLAYRALTLVQQSVAVGSADLIHVDPGLWQRGWQLYTSRPDKEWGLTDCFSFSVMQEQTIAEAFTADHHFAQAGFVRLLQPAK
jgi:uncharacterized protein